MNPGRKIIDDAEQIRQAALRKAFIDQSFSTEDTLAIILRNFQDDVTGLKEIMAGMSKHKLLKLGILDYKCADIILHSQQLIKKFHINELLTLIGAHPGHYNRILSKSTLNERLTPEHLFELCHKYKIIFDCVREDLNLMAKLESQDIYIAHLMLKYSDFGKAKLKSNHIVARFSAQALTILATKKSSIANKIFKDCANLEKFNSEQLTTIGASHPKIGIKILKAIEGSKLQQEFSANQLSEIGEKNRANAVYIIKNPKLQAIIMSDEDALTKLIAKHKEVYNVALRSNWLNLLSNKNKIKVAQNYPPYANQLLNNVEFLDGCDSEDFLEIALNNVNFAYKLFRNNDLRFKISYGKLPAIVARYLRSDKKEYNLDQSHQSDLRSYLEAIIKNFPDVQVVAYKIMEDLRTKQTGDNADTSKTNIGRHNTAPSYTGARKAAKGSS